jgi:L-ascorbate metabolism protein UlaG (beta-lactamase superfamily)
MEITYIGHSCFKIKDKELTIIIDPYDPKKLGYKLPKLEADVLCLTHNHSDHSYKEGVVGYRLLIDGPGEYETKETFIYGIEVYHDDKDGSERGTNTMYLIEMDGFNILHTGDLGHELSKETLEKIPNVDVLLICVGGTYTIDAETASQVISDIEPAIVVPMHYQTDDLTGLSEKLDKVDKFLNEMGVEGSVKKEDKLKLTSKNDLPEDTEVVVLNPQH